jgi:lysophospholipase L1-like esterase
MRGGGGFVRRGCAYAAVATTVTTAAQAGVLTATYVTAPEAKGPRFGLECRQTTTTSTTSSGAAGRRRVVFVAGDSTVCGVGCATSDRCDGPTLPRRLARALGEALDVDVEWRALGYKGADVRALRAKLLPALREAMMRGGEDEVDGGMVSSSSSSSSSPPHAVVLMCGLNDAKHSIVGRTTTEFRRDLEALVRDIRDVVGEKCVVVIPATPLEAATLFPPPLVWVATRMNDAWDAQKRRVSELAENVVFVSKPSLEALRARVTKENGGRVVVQLTCADGVHPNDDGYAAWAAHIADECAPSLKAALNAELRD